MVYEEAREMTDSPGAFASWPETCSSFETCRNFSGPSSRCRCSSSCRTKWFAWSRPSPCWRLWLPISSCSRSPIYQAQCSALKLPFTTRGARTHGLAPAPAALTLPFYFLHGECRGLLRALSRLDATQEHGLEVRPGVYPLTRRVVIDTRQDSAYLLFESATIGRG